MKENENNPKVEYTRKDKFYYALSILFDILKWLGIAFIAITSSFAAGVIAGNNNSVKVALIFFTLLVLWVVGIFMYLKIKKRKVTVELNEEEIQAQENPPENVKKITEVQEQPSIPEPQPALQVQNYVHSPEIDLTMLKQRLKIVSYTTPEKEVENPKYYYVYQKPPLELLDKSESYDINNYEELKTNICNLEKLFKDFKISIKGIDAYRSSSITCYEIQPGLGVRISQILGLKDEIVVALASPIVNIQAPIPNKAAIGIEVSNQNRQPVHLRDIMESKEYIQLHKRLSICLGKNMENQAICADLHDISPLLIGGTTGSGKSICLHSIIVNLLYKSANDVKLVLIDTFGSEFNIYNGIPHLLVPTITDCSRAVGVLRWAIVEMSDRYKKFAEHGVKDINGFNQKVSKENSENALPDIVIIIDDISDMVKAYPDDVKNNIRRIVQTGRATGIHLIIATQRPSVKVVAGIIKACIPNRIAFTLASRIDSQIVLDSIGAEKLLGSGDMLMKTLGSTELKHIQGCYVSDNEIANIVNFLKNEYSEPHNNEAEQEIIRCSPDYNLHPKSDFYAETELTLMQAIDIITDLQMASTTLLQRKLKLGYARATRLLDELEQLNVVGPFEGSKPRQVLITKKQWKNVKSELNSQVSS